jgi:hypothetical protein
MIDGEGPGRRHKAGRASKDDRDYSAGWLERRILKLHREVIDEPLPAEWLKLLEIAPLYSADPGKEERVAVDRWWPFTAKMLEYERNEPGVYEFATSSGIIAYIGSSSRIRNRLREHLGEDPESCIKQHATQYRVDYRSDYKLEQGRLCDEFVVRNGKMPECNDARA